MGDMPFSGECFLFSKESTSYSGCLERTGQTCASHQALDSQSTKLAFLNKRFDLRVHRFQANSQREPAPSLFVDSQPT